jgi:hypothetical protein
MHYYKVTLIYISIFYMIGILSAMKVTTSFSLAEGIPVPSNEATYSNKTRLQNIDPIHLSSLENFLRSANLTPNPAIFVNREAKSSSQLGTISLGGETFARSSENQIIAAIVIPLTKESTATRTHTGYLLAASSLLDVTGKEKLLPVGAHIVKLALEDNAVGLSIVSKLTDREGNIVFTAPHLSSSQFMQLAQKNLVPIDNLNIVNNLPKINSDVVTATTDPDFLILLWTL